MKKFWKWIDQTDLVAQSLMKNQMISQNGKSLDAEGISQTDLVQDNNNQSEQVQSGTKTAEKSEPVGESEPAEEAERILMLNGTIAEDSWFDDDVTPGQFRDELNAGKGNITVWINSPGGDCIAAAQIYNMLSEYPGKVTVKVDGLAASAASVIAMAGDEVLMSPVSMLMIHNPATMAFGDHSDMQKAIELLDAVKESIINSYVKKTGLSRARLSHLMDAETWMDANKAVELGFADGILYGDANANATDQTHGRVRNAADGACDVDSVLFSRKAVNNALVNKLEKHFAEDRKPAAEQARIVQENSKVVTGRSAEEIRGRLSFIKKFI